MELRSELEVRCTERDNHASLAETLRQRVTDLERQLNESSERERTLHLEKFALHNRVDEVHACLYCEVNFSLSLRWKRSSVS